MKTAKITDESIICFDGIVPVYRAEIFSAGASVAVRFFSSERAATVWAQAVQGASLVS